MNKRHLHHQWRRFRYVRSWYFLIIAIVSGVVCVYALRANNEHMVVLRNDVYAADKNNGDVAGTLAALQSYVTRHMNTELNSGPNAVYPPIQLKYTYDRLVQQASDQATQANSKIYNDAQTYCEGLNHTDFSGHNRVPCIEQYVQSHSATTAPTIPDDLYKFSFASPVWSPDRAGWSMVIAAASGVLFFVTFLAEWWYKRNLS